MPINATNILVTLTDGQEAYFNNGEWTVSDIEDIEQPEPCIPSIDCRLEAAESVIMEMLEMMML
jgi:hypothetical protein